VAAPGDIDPPDVAEPNLDRPAVETGAYAVNDRAGAVTYSLLIPVAASTRCRTSVRPCVLE